MQHGQENILKVNFIDFYSTTMQISHNYMYASPPSVYPLLLRGFPGGSDGKKSTCQCKRPGFSPWVEEIPRRREGHPTPVLPGESHGQRNLVGYSPWGHTTSDKTERLHFHFFLLLGPPSPTPSHPSRLSQSTKLGALCYVSASY